MDWCRPSHLTTEPRVSVAQGRWSIRLRLGELPQEVVDYRPRHEPDDEGQRAKDDGDVVHVAQHRYEIRDRIEGHHEVGREEKGQNPGETRHSQVACNHAEELQLLPGA